MVVEGIAKVIGEDDTLAIQAKMKAPIFPSVQNTGSKIREQAFSRSSKCRTVSTSRRMILSASTTTTAGIIKSSVIESMSHSVIIFDRLNILPIGFCFISANYRCPVQNQAFVEQQIT